MTAAQNLDGGGAMTKVRLSMVSFGAIVGIVGFLHGLASMLQGSRMVTSRSVKALPEGWPNEEFNAMTSGSPVYTVLTDLPFYALGILAVLASTALIVCSLTLVRTLDLRWAAILFAVLNVGIFLFGAGRGTPIFLSLPTFIVAMISAYRFETRERSETGRQRLLIAFWFFYGLHIASWVLFFPGLFISSFYAEIPVVLFVLSFVCMPIGAFGALITGYKYDRSI